MQNVIRTATHGLPDLVLPNFTKFKTGPNISSSARAFSTLELPIRADNSPENVVARMPIGIRTLPPYVMSCNTLYLLTRSLLFKSNEYILK